jgi:hypothetical protein
MGYFSDIIKDSRMTPAGRSARRLAGKKAPDAADTNDSRLAPPEAVPVEPRRVSAEIVEAPRPKTRRSRRRKKSQDTRPRSGTGDEHAGPDGPDEATDANVAIPVIQRKTLTTSAPHSTAAANPTVRGGQSAWSSPGRPGVRRATSKRISASTRTPDAAAGSPMQMRSRRIDQPAGELREKTNRQHTPPIEPEIAADVTEAPPTAEPSVTPAARQPQRSEEAAVPVEAQTIRKPALPSSAEGTVRQIENVYSTSAGRLDAPRVQIGQINVIVEESRIPPKAPPEDQRRDDVASRTFLRSL